MKAEASHHMSRKPHTKLGNEKRIKSVSTPTPCIFLALQDSIPQDPREGTTNMSITYLLGENCRADNPPPPQGDTPSLRTHGSKGTVTPERCTRWSCVTITALLFSSVMIRSGLTLMILLQLQPHYP